ncbi:cAMP-binding domain of CRP or a regulatory subunit of cAMP-dependent protein kinases [Chryseobacterium sp. RU37D]|uniref:Crp/Fnr family transcriptional regulator n=1 Tax=Chryseobacterium sp. RU37D TaxID=1907397 RepID=UPI000954D27C|nr:Crp/Fnr family transcriptional regulator [Chryseobacterium sp. RU37D]SIQ35829.1 cAMP-binding domain of CRP or a regulatory subunit of cAMP-dependent protein kinases [Chryseobacterium sp. RU37D]
MNQFWYFENINLFDLLCPHKFKSFADTHTFLHFKKNDFIYMEGDVAKKFYLISKGKVKIGFREESGEEIVTAYLKKGEIFGESVMLNQKTRKEFAQAVENQTELCHVTLRQAEELMKGNNNFSVSIYKFIGYKFRKIERKYQIMLFRNTKTRAIEFIKEMMDDGFASQKLLNGEILVQNPYSQSEMAKLIGTSRSTFNLLINELQEDDFLLWEKGKILLKNKFLLEF